MMVLTKIGRVLARSATLVFAIAGSMGCNLGETDLAVTEDPAVADDEHSNVTERAVESTDVEGSLLLTSTFHGEHLLLSEQSSATAAMADVALAAWPVDWFLHLTPGTPAPLVVRHPSGVNTVWIFGGTVFLPNDFVTIGKSFLVMQDDGNFVLYDENYPFSPARWAADTFGRGERAVFQTDANLVVYDAFGPVRTSKVPSNTCCHSGWNLHVQEDGNVVIYSPGWQPRWSTGTFH